MQTLLFMSREASREWQYIMDPRQEGQLSQTYASLILCSWRIAQLVPS